MQNGPLEVFFSIPLPMASTKAIPERLSSSFFLGSGLSVFSTGPTVSLGSFSKTCPSPYHLQPLFLSLGRDSSTSAPFSLEKGGGQLVAGRVQAGVRGSTHPHPGDQRQGSGKQGFWAGLETNQADGSRDNPAECSHPNQVRRQRPGQGEPQSYGLAPQLH